MAGKRCPPRPQTKSTHVWDLVAEEYNKNVPTDRQREKGQLENKYNNLKKAFRAYCRDLHSKAKSGAGRDELLLVAKPQSHDSAPGASCATGSAKTQVCAQRVAKA